ncbi:hypothetical protein H7U22_06700 [Pedobacter sp. CCM 8938]|uniref:Uncharacterized protein n=1 Tax=Pedobacter fastidiosus TaxID=2765361 RepID=A0ABR7KPU1_9SPHI|nr:hypothetical protein [Pedobacter fastidiosus]
MNLFSRAFLFWVLPLKYKSSKKSIQIACNILVLRHIFPSFRGVSAGRGVYFTIATEKQIYTEKGYYYFLLKMNVGSSSETAAPLFVPIFFKDTVMLRHEASVSSVADASCLSITAYSGLLQ